ERIESLAINVLGLYVMLHLGLLIFPALLQHRPADRDDDEPSTHLYHRQRDSKKLKDVVSNEICNHQYNKRVQSNLSRQGPAHVRPVSRGSRQENRAIA